MGLLDDAIREHLELKRRHGANPEDVQRQEQEALGGATRRAEFARPDGESGETVPSAEAPETVVRCRGGRGGAACGRAAF
jgi:hypothetical protein